MTESSANSTDLDHGPLSVRRRLVLLFNSLTARSPVPQSTKDNNAPSGDGEPMTSTCLPSQILRTPIVVGSLLLSLVEFEGRALAVTNFARASRTRSV